MNRTQKNVKKYEGMLPGLKEKLAAAAMLFAMTAAMLVTSTFAWLTLSYNPQVQNVHTAVASNGNLEIALATGEMDSATAPGASTSSDGSLETVLRNLTWGNLINLNDSSYGLSHIVMRPAILNDSNLIERPLYGPVYDNDGRVKDLDTNFGYSKWDTAFSRFSHTKELGVRAITSMTYGESGDSVTMNLKLLELESANARLRSNYESMANNDDYMDALASMMVGYMIENQFKQTGAGDYLDDAPLKEADLLQFGKMYEALIGLFEDQAEVYAALLNLQAEANKNDSMKITASEILAMEYGSKKAYNALLAKGYKTYASNVKTVGIIKDMDNFLTDYNTLKSDLVRINDLLENHVKGSIKWIDCPTVEGSTVRIIDDIIAHLTKVSDCTITGGDLNNTKVSNIGGTAAMGLATSCKKDNPAQTKITNGILYNFDNRCGGRIKNPESKPLKLVVKPKGLGALMGTQTIYSHVSTTATDNYFENERAYLANIIKEEYSEPDLIAKDSYGFAVDFWVRTNAAYSYLTLEGNVLTETEKIDVKGKDKDGNEVQIYTITVKLESSESEGEGEGGILDDLANISYDVYESTEEVTNAETGETSERDCWRFADNHQVVTPESLGLAEGEEIPTPRKKITEVENVIGFEGDNRVWNGSEHSLLSVSSTTQGSGSCYTFYAETPADQQRSLELLKAMKVAFVDESGELLTTAYMDTERHYASSGKVIVPLVLDKTKSQAITVLEGETKYAITALEQNVPKRISAIVYLDGANLTNEHVLAAADIQGQMNIQFGSSAALVPLGNEELYNSEFYAEVTKITRPEFDYDENADMSTTVKVKATGAQPTQMTARFIRRINATQGTLEPESFELNDTDGDGIWEGTYTFKHPGEYILRSVWVDGNEVDLRIPEGEDFPKVLVKGFMIQSVDYWIDNFVMTDADSHSGNVHLKFATDDQSKMPKSVVGKFVRTDGAEVNVNFAYNSTEANWQGTANFAYSGEYTMQYVVLDGLYEELPPAMQTTVDLTLGMKVDVKTTSPKEIFCDDPNAPTALKMQVEIFDNNNDIIENLAGARLFYKATGLEPIEAELQYNSGARYYEGELPVEAGTWSFDRVEIRIGDSHNNLRRVNSDAPSFRIIPPTPPSFVRNNDTQIFAQYLKAGNNAKFSATLADSSSAIVYAKAVRNDGTVIYAPSVESSETTDGNILYMFDITESGLWKVESVSVFGMFDENKEYHAVPDEVNEETYSTGIVFDSSNSALEEIEIAVLYENDITVSYSYASDLVNVDTTNKSLVLGKNADGTVTGTFMQSHTLKNGAVTVTITDTAGLIENGYFDISNVSLSYKYDGLTDSKGNSYGGYTGGDYTAGLGIGSLKFNKNNGTTFKLTSDGANALTFTYAARYAPTNLNYTITPKGYAGENIEFSAADAYKVEVYSKVPSVKIIGVTPNPNDGKYSVDESTSGKISDDVRTGKLPMFGTTEYTTNSVHKAKKYSSSFTDTSATVYYKCGHTDSATYSADVAFWISIPAYHNYSQPTVTIGIENIGNASYASLSFTDSNKQAAMLYEKSEGTTKTSYSWTKEEGCERYIGYWYSETGNDEKTVAGTITADTLIMKYNDKEYSFVIPKITINNPY